MFSGIRIAGPFGLAVCVLFGAGTVAAQEYPVKPITMVAANNPGTNPDTVARIMATEMTKFLGQPMVVENKPSTNGVIGYGYVAKLAPADGYSLVAVSVLELASLQATVKDLRFDPLKDLPPLIGLAEGKNVFGSASKLPWKTFNEMVAHAKANPGKLNYGAPGANVRIPMEVILRNFGLNVIHIPYASGGSYLQALSSGEIQMGTLGEGSAVGMGERFRVLAVTGQTRRAPFLEVPTFRELGLPQIPGLGYSLNVATGIPKPAFDKLAAAAAKTLELPDVKARFAKIGLDILSEPSDAAAKRLAEAGKLFTETAKAIGLEPQ